MEMAALYEALAKLPEGSKYIETIKAEITRLNNEAAAQRIDKKKFESKVKELESTITDLKEKGTGDLSTIEKMQKQLDELQEKYETAENSRKEEKAKRVKTDIANQTIAALTKGNAVNPAEISKILINSVNVEEDGSYKFTNAKGEKVSIEDGANEWLKGNAWAVKNTQNGGSGGNRGNGGGAPVKGGLAEVIAAKLGEN